MADIAPLRALKFTNEKLANVVAPPYDVIGPEERAKLAARSPHNIVHLDLPEGDGDSRYANAAKTLDSWLKDRVLVRDDKPALFRYDQTFTPPVGGARITRTGFFALVRAEPYENKVILPHERTLLGPKEDRYKLFCATRAALSPVFLLYQDPTGAVAQVLGTASSGGESFETEDGIVHRLTRIDDAAAIARVTSALAGRQLLIADGHHRYETTLRYGAAIDDERKAQGKPAAPNGAHKFVMAFLSDADDPGLIVFPTHRVVHSLPGFDRAALLARAKDTFTATETRADDVKVLVDALAAAGRNGPSVAAVFPDGAATILTLRNDVDVAKHPALGARPAVLRKTDVVVLHAAILEQVLGISTEAQAKQTNLAYWKSADEAVKRIRRGEGDVLFLMNSTPVSEVRAACEGGEVMPQKSTYFYPKVLTGLLVHVLDPEETVA